MMSAAARGAVLARRASDQVHRSARRAAGARRIHSLQTELSGDTRSSRRRAMTIARAGGIGRTTPPDIGDGDGEEREAGAGHDNGLEEVVEIESVFGVILVSLERVERD